MKTKISIGRPIIILDRDGTLIKEPRDKQIDDFSKLRFIENLFQGLTVLKKLNPIFVMMTNQDGLGTAKYPTAKFKMIQEFLLNALKSEGFSFDYILICPHFKTDVCKCRKPSTLMLDQIFPDLQKRQGVVLGDRKCDMELAKKIGFSGIPVGRSLADGTDFYSACIKAFEYLTAVEVSRESKETQISLRLQDGSSTLRDISTGIPFFDHLLDQFFFHLGCQVSLQARGDTWIDDHHLVEDTAIVLGQGIQKLLKGRIKKDRYFFALPMDDAKAMCLIDFCQRPYLVFEGSFQRENLKDLASEMIEHFFYSFAMACGASVHVKVTGKNDHHKAEALFKCLGRALNSANLNSNDSHFASTKGFL
ncbi:MAG: histidinol-phosphatase [Pseudobdellovibrionaceae bacterium]